MRLVYFGSGTFGLPTLERLSNEHEVALVVTRPDQPAGRGRKPAPTPVAECAQRHGLPILKPQDVNEAGAVDRIQSIHAESFVVIAFGQKLSRSLLEEPFAINLHGSLLPKYRGAAPVNWAMINGETETGLSVIRLTDRMDAGDILAQVSTPIDPMETAGELHDRLANLGPPLTLNVLHQFSRGILRPKPQDDSLASRAPRLSKADGTVRFDQPAIRVRQRVHGLTPWPGCTVKLAGRRIRIARVRVVDESHVSSEPGRILDDFTISCLPGRIELLSVQPSSGKLMSFEDYRRGHPLSLGARLEPI